MREEEGGMPPESRMVLSLGVSLSGGAGAVLRVFLSVFFLQRCIRIELSLGQNCLYDQLYPGSSGVQAHLSVVLQSSYDFNVLAVGATLRQLHILNRFRVDELRVSAYALAPELVSHPYQAPALRQSHGNQEKSQDSPKFAVHD